MRRPRAPGGLEHLREEEARDRMGLEFHHRKLPREVGLAPEHRREEGIGVHERDRRDREYVAEEPHVAERGRALHAECVPDPFVEEDRAVPACLSCRFAPREHREGRPVDTRTFRLTRLEARPPLVPCERIRIAERQTLRGLRTTIPAARSDTRVRRAERDNRHAAMPFGCQSLLDRAAVHAVAGRQERAAEASRKRWSEP